MRQKLEGREVRFLMRSANVSIADVAGRMSVAKARVKRIRRDGVEGALVVTDWVQGITGEDTFDAAEYERQLARKRGRR